MAVISVVAGYFIMEIHPMAIPTVEEALEIEGMPILCDQID